MSAQQNYQKKVMQVDHISSREVDRDTLIKSHLKLVVSMAYKFRKFGELDDLIQEGNLALVKAADSYNPEVGEFSTHAMSYIKGAFYESTIKEPLVKTITTKAHRKAFFKHRKYMDQNGHISIENRQKMVEELGLTEAEVNDFILRNSTAVESIFADVGETGDFEIAFNAPSDSTWQPEVVLEHLERENLLLKVHETIEKLNDREKDIIKSRWLVDDPMHFAALSEKYGVSFQRIQQIEKAALAKVRKALTESCNSV